MPIYKGNTLVGGGGVSLIYKGSTLVYRHKFEPVLFTENGSWVVPTGITKIKIDCVAAAGLWYSVRNQDNLPGYGGRVECVLNVIPKQTLFIIIGKIPTQAAISEYNASDIRTNNAGILDASSLQSRLVVAGGGGGGVSGGSHRYGGSGGNGGGVTGANGTTPGLSSAGSGGSQSAGGQGGIGSGGHNGAPGGFGLGGNGSATAGGAGWYGGGGGALAGHNSIFYYSGGGGGSSYTHPTLCSSVVHTQGFNKGNGYVKISMVE